MSYIFVKSTMFKFHIFSANIKGRCMNQIRITIYNRRRGGNNSSQSFPNSAMKYQFPCQVHEIKALRLQKID